MNTKIVAKLLSARVDSSGAPRTVAAAVAAALLSACGSAPVRHEPATERAERPAPRPSSRIAKAPTAPATSSAPRATRGGGYYLDDGPGEAPPADLDTIPDAVPQWEPLNRGTMKPYVVLGQTFTPMTELQPYKARGVASWYGRRYHGKPTSNGETYDMYGMTAAHPILPIPSYVRVTNMATGKSVVVRVNDRGPFLENRLIDLSYTAAHRIGVLAGGSAVVEVEAILPDASGPSSTMIASAPTARTRYSAPRVAPPLQQSSTPAPAPSINAPVATPSELAAQADPIIAIAAAARDTSAVVARPLSGDSPADSPSAPVTVSPRVESALAAAPVRAASSESSGVYLQLGAFGSRENAESFLARTRTRIDWLAQMLQLVPRDGMYRVHAGPYATTSEARLAAERIAAGLGTKPMVVTR